MFSDIEARLERMAQKEMASMEFESAAGELRLVFSGRLDAEAAGFLWKQAVNRTAQAAPQTLVVNAAAVDYCDTVGAGFLLQLKKSQQRTNGQFRIEGLRPEFAQLIELFDPGDLTAPVPEPTSFRRVAEQIGRATVNTWADVKGEIAFLGEMCAKLTYTLFHPHTLRWQDTFLIAEKSGADAVGITAMLGFLIGLILAFQSAVAMAKFGAQIFTADLVAIATLRELGPLITAFVFAARSGSAYAAEIGTMKVNEEIDALTTMGLDPVRFLVVPRTIAGIFAVPLLTMFNNLFSLAGCAFVMMAIGFAPITVFHQIQNAATMTDLLSGLVKTVIFGALIAGIGCLRGLQTGTGASAVGDSATRAVVSGIVAIVLADGVFAVLFFYLGI
jgi:phospholipid/cholesterol/gamma-HCH transport system permease protein